MIRRYGNAPWRAAVLNGGPGAPGTIAGVARELGKTVGTVEPIQSRASIGGLIMELRDQLAELTEQPLLLAGHSWGAWLSLLFAAHYPERVRRLVLVGSGPLIAEYAEQIPMRRSARLTTAQNAEFAEELAALRNESDGSRRNAALNRVKELTRLSDHFHSRPTRPEEKDDILPFSAAQYAAVWPEAEKLRADGVLLEAARKLQCPVTVLHGEDDPHPWAGVVEPLRATGAKLDVHIFHRCGHCPFNEEFAAEPFFAVLRTLAWA